MDVLISSLLLRVGVLSKLLIDQRLSLAMVDFIRVDEPEGGDGVGKRLINSS